MEPNRRGLMGKQLSLYPFQVFVRE